MTRISCFCYPAMGHIYPLTALARELSGAGHAVSIVSVADARAPFAAQQFPFTGFGAALYPPGTTAERDRELGTLDRAAGMRRTVADLLCYGRAVMADAQAVLEQLAPDLLVIDQADIFTPVLAAAMRIPFVTVALALMANREDGVPPFSCHVPWPEDPAMKPAIKKAQIEFRSVWKPCLDLANAFRERYGQRRVLTPDDLFSGLAQITQQPLEFDLPRVRLPRHFHYTGPFVNRAARPEIPFPYDRLDGRPLVFASFGTLQNRRAGYFQCAAEACAGLDVQLVASLGGAELPESTGNLPGNPLIVPLAPQLDLLARATAMITHAGLNSALESLAAGVPMVAVPVTNDQPGVSARIARTGTGTVVPIAELDVSRLRRALQTVLTDSSYRCRAEAFRDRIAATNGLGRAADIIGRVIGTGQPVLRQPATQSTADGWEGVVYENCH